MKNLIIIILIAITSFGCSKNNDDPKTNIPGNLIGKWKLIEIYTNSGNGENYWVKTDTGKPYDIWYKENSEIVISSMSENCNTGTFVVSSDNKITYSFPCTGDSNVKIESLSETNLITDVTYIEYELNKYQKISDQNPII